MSTLKNNSLTTASIFVFSSKSSVKHFYDIVTLNINSGKWITAGFDWIFLRSFLCILIWGFMIRWQSWARKMEEKMASSQARQRIYSHHSKLRVFASRLPSGSTFRGPNTNISAALKIRASQNGSFRRLRMNKILAGGNKRTLFHR